MPSSTLHRALLVPACLAAITLSAAAATVPEAVRQAPAVDAALQRANAAHLRATSAGRWADPELEGMYSEKDTLEESFPMWSASLTQPLPKLGERGADKARARAAWEMARAEADLMAGETAADVAMALAERDAALQRKELLVRQLERTERVGAAVEARLAAGQGRLAERFTLQSRLTELRLAVERATREIENAEAEVRQPLGLGAGDLPGFAAPAGDAIQPEAAPGMRLLAAQSEESKAMAAMARAAARPMTAVSVSFEREEPEMGNEDTVGVALMTEVPWNSRRYARADEKAALAELSSRQADAEALSNRIEADVARAARMRRLASETESSARETRERIEREYDALVAATGAASGMQESSSLLMLLELLDRSTDLDMQVIEAEAEARAAEATLWKYQSLLTGDEP
jgi:cobalt-zinc-cadmium efflux system outer membrane protein